MRFEEPWVLMLLVPAALLAWRRMRRSGEAALEFSAVEPAASLRATPRARLARLPFWLRVAALCLLVVALARPQSGGERTRQTGQGIAIQMVIDRSGSMNAPILFAGSHTTRFELAKRFLREFVTGDGEKLEGRGSDAVGIVAFARNPETVCPLSFAHDAVAGLVSGLRIAERKEDNATAIGDAVALAAARLKTSAGRDAKSRVVVLLTDGENTAGVRSVAEAGQLAANWGVRVHAIGITGPAPASGVAAYGYNMHRRLMAERQLGQLAAACGGIYRSVQDGDALKSVYAEIDRLEKSELATTKYTGGAERFGPAALSALALLMAASILSGTWLRRLP
jgi:Ca-activated chloride channel homolog